MASICPNCSNRLRLRSVRNAKSNRDAYQATTPAAQTALSTLRDGYEALAHDLLAGIDPADLAACQSVLGTVQQRLPQVVETRAAATPPPAKPHPGAPHPQTRP